MLVQIDKDTIVETNRIISIITSGADTSVKLTADGATTVTETITGQRPAEVLQTIREAR